MEALELIKAFANTTDNIWLQEKVKKVEQEFNKISSEALTEK